MHSSKNLNEGKGRLHFSKTNSITPTPGPQSSSRARERRRGANWGELERRRGALGTSVLLQAAGITNGSLNWSTKLAEWIPSSNAQSVSQAAPIYSGHCSCPFIELESMQVSGDVPTLPWVRSRVWVGAGLRFGLGLREGWVDTSPEPWIDSRTRTRTLAFWLQGHLLAKFRGVWHASFGKEFVKYVPIVE